MRLINLPLIKHEFRALQMKVFNFPQKTFRNSDVMPSMPGDLLFFIVLKTLPSSKYFKEKCPLDRVLTYKNLI